MSISETALKTAATVGQSLDRAMQLQRRAQERNENIASQYAIDESDFGTVHPDLLPHIQKEYDKVLLARQSLIKNESGASARLRQAKQRYDNELTVMKARTKEYIDDRAAIQSGESLNKMEDLDNNWNGMVRELTGYTDEETKKYVEPVDFFQSSFVDVTKPLLTPIAKPPIDAATINFPINMMETRVQNKIGTLQEGETVTREQVQNAYDSELKYLYKYPEYQDAVIAHSFQNASEVEKEKGYVAYKQDLIATMSLEGEANLFNDAEKKYKESLKEEVVNETYNFYSGRREPKKQVDLPLISAFESPEGVYDEEEGLYRPEGKGSPLTIPMGKNDVIIAPSENERVVVTPDGKVKYYSKEFEAQTGDVYIGVETGTKAGNYAFAEVSEFPISEKLAGNIERAKEQAKLNLQNELMKKAKGE